MEQSYDVIVIGGSYAGLSAAMSLARFSHRILIIDAGKPCNRQTPESHNFITHDGQAPAVIAAQAKTQVAQYPTVTFYNAKATKARYKADAISIQTDTKQTFYAKKLILANGILDNLPPIKGAEACWGISLLHCPYCHGYEFKGQELAVMAQGEMAMHLLPLLRLLSAKVTLLTNGPSGLSTDEVQLLQAKDIRIIETPVSEFIHQNGHIQEVRFADSYSLPFDAVYAKVGFSLNGSFVEDLALATNAAGYIAVNNMQQTNIPAVFACGDNTSPQRSVANAVAAGNFTGAAVNKELAALYFSTS